MSRAVSALHPLLHLASESILRQKAPVVESYLPLRATFCRLGRCAAPLNPRDPPYEDAGLVPALWVIR